MLPDLLPYPAEFVENQQAAARQRFLPAPAEESVPAVPAATSSSAPLAGAGAGTGAVVVSEGYGSGGILAVPAAVATASGGSPGQAAAVLPAAGNGEVDREVEVAQRNWLANVGQLAPGGQQQVQPQPQPQPFAHNTNAVNTAVASVHEQHQLLQPAEAMEELSVDVSAPSAFASIADMAAAAPQQLLLLQQQQQQRQQEPQRVRQAPARDAECCFCKTEDGTLLDCGVTECGVGGGACLRHGEGPVLGCCGDGVPAADGNRGDGVAVCSKRFHFLCAWFAGAYVKVEVTDPSFTRGERGLSADMSVWPEAGQARFGFPTGMSVEVRCLEHSVGAPGRKGAPPMAAAVRELAGAEAMPPGTISPLADTAGAVVTGTTSEEQSELRCKYRMKVCACSLLTTPPHPPLCARAFESLPCFCVQCTRFIACIWILVFIFVFCPPWHGIVASAHLAVLTFW